MLVPRPRERILDRCLRGKEHATNQRQRPAFFLGFRILFASQRQLETVGFDTFFGTMPLLAFWWALLHRSRPRIVHHRAARTRAHLAYLTTPSEERRRVADADAKVHE